MSNDIETLILNEFEEKKRIPNESKKDSQNEDILTVNIRPQTGIIL
jgi:hypothetical protein